MSEIDAVDITKLGTAAIIDQSVTKSKNPGIVKVNLPDKAVQGIQPAFGMQTIAIWITGLVSIQGKVS